MIGSATTMTSSAPASPSSRSRAATCAAEPSIAGAPGVLGPLAGAAGEADEGAGAAEHVGGLAAGGARRGIDRRAERGEALGAVAEVGEPRVPPGRVRKRDGEHARSVGADHQRGRDGGAGEEHRVVRLPEAPGDRDALAREQPADDPEGLLEAADAAVVGEAVGAELALVPACPETEHEAAAADLRDRRRHLGDQRRRVEGGARDQRAEADPLGGRGEGGQHRPRLPRAALRAAVPGCVEQVIAHPDGVEPDLLRGPRHREVLRPAHLALDLGELDADPQAAAPAGRHQLPTSWRAEIIAMRGSPRSRRTLKAIAPVTSGSPRYVAT